ETFKGVPLLLPREGPYDIDLNLTFFRLKGKSHCLKIPHSSIVELFLLPKGAPESDVFVIMEIEKSDSLPPYIVLEEASNGRVTNALQDMFDDKIKGPDKILKAYYGASEGWLYTLERLIFFLPRPFMMIEYDKIERIKFVKHSNTKEHYKFFIKVNNEPENSFMIWKKDAQPLLEYMSGKGVKCSNVEKQVAEWEKELKAKQDEVKALVKTEAATEIQAEITAEILQLEEKIQSAREGPKAI
ncbi:unnamed protein product, partial [Linum tenue]